MRALLVYNPGSRLSSRVSADDLARCLEAEGAEHVDLACDGLEALPAHIADACRSGCDRIVAAGGDGTVHSVLQFVAGTGLPLAVVPLGTGNVLADEIGLRTGDWRAACHVAMAGAPAPMDLGLAGGRYFATMFGAGMDAQVAYDLGRRHKARLGRWAFVDELLGRIARSSPSSFAISVGDDTLEILAWAAVVCNTPRYAWRLYLRPDACPDDGVMDLCVLAQRSRLGLFANLALNFGFARPVLHGGMHCREVTSVRVDADPPVHWQVDGEVCGMTPVDVSVMPAALRLITPTGRL